MRINLLVTLLFVLITAVGLALLVRQAGYDVQSEMQAPKRWSTACAVRRALRVLDELLDGLQQVGQGQFDARLRRYGLPEAWQLVGHFNAMSSTLQPSAGR